MPHPSNHPRADKRPPQDVRQRRKRPHVIGQLLASVAEHLDLPLGRRIGDHQPADFPVRVSQGVTAAWSAPDGWATGGSIFCRVDGGAGARDSGRASHSCVIATTQPLSVNCRAIPGRSRIGSAAVGKTAARIAKAKLRDGALSEQNHQTQESAI